MRTCARSWEFNAEQNFKVPVLMGLVFWWGKTHYEVAHHLSDGDVCSGEVLGRTRGLGSSGWGEGCSLIQAIRQGLSARVTAVRDLKKTENLRQSWISEKRVFQAEGMARAKVLRWEDAWDVPGTVCVAGAE